MWEHKQRLEHVRQQQPLLDEADAKALHKLSYTFSNPGDGITLNQHERVGTLISIYINIYIL